MVNIEELRVGSFVQDESGNILAVAGIPSNKEERREWLGCIYPVPIDEKILSKSGFIKKNYSWVLILDDWKKVKSGEGCIWTTLRPSLIIYTNGDFYIDAPMGATPFFEGFNMTRVDGLLYLHQLQHLYYLLTNKPLDFKP